MAKETIILHEIELSKNEIKTAFGISMQTISKLEKSDPKFPKITANKKFNLLELIHFFQSQKKTNQDSTLADAKLKLVQMQSRRIALQIRERQLDLVEIAYAKDQIQKILQEVKSKIERLPRDIAKKCDGKDTKEIEIIAKQVITENINSWIGSNISV